MNPEFRPPSQERIGWGERLRNASERLNQMRRSVREQFSNFGRLNAGEWIRNQADRLRGGWNRMVDRLRGRNQGAEAAARNTPENRPDTVDARAQEALSEIQDILEAYMDVVMRPADQIQANPEGYAEELQAVAEQFEARIVELNNITDRAVQARVAEVLPSTFASDAETLEQIARQLAEDPTNEVLIQGREAVNERLAEALNVRVVAENVGGRERLSRERLRRSARESLASLQEQARRMWAERGRVDLDDLYANNRELVESVVASGITFAGRRIANLAGVAGALAINMPVMAAREMREWNRDNQEPGRQTEAYQKAFQRLAGQNAESIAPQQDQENQKWYQRLAEGARLGLKYVGETFMLPEKLALLLFTKPHKRAEQLTRALKGMAGEEMSPEGFQAWADAFADKLASREDVNGAEKNIDQLLDLAYQLMGMELYGNDLPKKMSERLAETGVGAKLGFKKEGGWNQVDRTVINPEVLRQLQAQLKELLNSEQVRAFLEDPAAGHRPDSVTGITQMRMVLNDENLKQELLDNMAKKERLKLFGARVFGLLFKAGVIAEGGQRILRGDVVEGKPVQDIPIRPNHDGIPVRDIDATHNGIRVSQLDIEQARADAARAAENVARRVDQARMDLTHDNNTLSEVQYGGMPIDQVAENGLNQVARLEGGTWQAIQTSFNQYVDHLRATGVDVSTIDALRNPTINAVKNAVLYGGVDFIMYGEDVRYMNELVTYALEHPEEAANNPLLRAVLQLGPNATSLTDPAVMREAAQVVANALRVGGGLRDDMEALE